MLTVTKPALERLAHRLDRKEAAEGMALRFTRRTGGWKLRVDLKTAGDTSFRHEGRTVLLLDPKVAEAMAKMTLDVGALERGNGLHLFRNTRRDQD